MKRVYLFLLLVALVACNSEKVVPETALFQEWTHAWEEQEGASNELIFRLSDSQVFPRTWYRESFAFRQDGTCDYLFLFPTDGSRFMPGTFTYDETLNVLTIYNESGDLYKAFDVHQLSGDKLVLEQR